MKLRTEIEKTPSDSRFMIGYEDSIMTVGSCFSDNIGQQFKNRFFDICVNPAGTLFNPCSIARSLRMIADLSHPRSTEELVMTTDDSLWHSLDFHGRFSSASPGRVLSLIEESVNEAHSFLKHCTRVFITLGSNHIYVDKRSGNVVANCHRLPAARFDHQTLSVGETADALEQSIQSIRDIAGNNCRVTFTVSPVRHTAYTLHGNNLAKSTLILAVDSVVSNHPDNVDYFPAYEIMMDDLRDYRFYDSDLKHPSATAIDYIFDILSGRYMSPDTISQAAGLMSLHRRLSHRPATDSLRALEQFRQTTADMARQLAAAMPPRVSQNILTTSKDELFNK